MTTRGRHGKESLAIGRQTLNPVFDFLSARAADRTPFFPWYGPMMPHEPHTPPARPLSRYRVDGRPERLARHFAMIEWFDETCGAVLDRLADEGLAENTLVIFCVDNGWIQDTTTTDRTGGALRAPKQAVTLRRRPPDTHPAPLAGANPARHPAGRGFRHRHRPDSASGRRAPTDRRHVRNRSAADRGRQAVLGQTSGLRRDLRAHRPPVGRARRQPSTPRGPGGSLETHPSGDR